MKFINIVYPNSVEYRFGNQAVRETVYKRGLDNGEFSRKESISNFEFGIRTIRYKSVCVTRVVRRVQLAYRVVGVCNYMEYLEGRTRKRSIPIGLRTFP